MKFPSYIPAGITDYYRDKGGASHVAPSGYVNSGFWSLYANAFAEDGSEDQLIAALTKSVPEQWLRERGIDTNDNVINRDWHDPKMSLKHPTLTTKKNVNWDRSTFDRTPDQFLDSYTKGLQTKLRNQFKSERKRMEAQGSANLRSMAEDRLGDEFKSIDAEANSRGLLYSGKRDSARASAASQKAGELGQATTDYLQSIGDMERGLNSDVFASELETSARQADINDLISGAFAKKLSNNIDTSRAQAKAAQNFGSGIGDLSGALAGRLRKKQGATL